MRLRVEVRLNMNSASLAASAARALEVDNRQSPKDVTVSCRAEGDKLIINVTCEKALRTLSTIEDIFTCLMPLMKLNDILKVRGVKAEKGF